MPADKRALTARRKLHMGWYLPNPAGTPSLPLGAQYRFDNVRPAFPSLNANWSEHRGYNGTFEAIGGMTRDPGHGTQQLVFERPYFSQLALIGEMAFHSGVSPTGADPYVWVHNSASTDYLAVVFTEAGGPLGAGGNNFVKTLQDGMVSKYVLEGDSSKAFLTATMDLVGNEPTERSSLTSESAHGFDTESIRQSWVNLYVDDSLGAIGSTQITCSRLKWKWTLDNKTGTVQTDCGPAHDRMPRTAQLELQLVLDENSASFYSDLIAETKRYVRLIATSPSSGQYWQLDWAGYFKTYQHGEQSPYDTITLVGMSNRAPAAGYGWQQTVSVDGLSAIPYTTIP